MNYLQFNDRGKFEPEEQALANYFGESNYIGFYKKHFLRDKFQITKNDFISGDIDVMFHAMKRLGIEYSYTDYPECLKPYLHRKIWESTLGEVRKRLFNDLGNEVELGLNWFIKPKDKLKRFTGFVCETIDDLSKCAGAGNQTKIWCSEPVSFTSEWRVLFKKKDIMSDDLNGCYYDIKITKYNKGIDNAAFAKVIEQVQNIIYTRQLVMFNELPAAFALDLGIMTNGEVALIEMNDAFSLGLYQNSSGTPKDELEKHYAKCLITRWEELKGDLK